MSRPTRTASSAANLGLRTSDRAARSPSDALATRLRVLAANALLAVVLLFAPRRRTRRVAAAEEEEAEAEAEAEADPRRGTSACRNSAGDATWTKWLSLLAQRHHEPADLEEA